MKFLKLFKIEWKYEIQIIIINDIYIYLIIFGHAKLTICPYYHFHKFHNIYEYEGIRKVKFSERSYRMNSHPYACNREVTFKEET
ncbi:hypothetical protein PFBG_05348 [Plasmodium falciparum 7G8]|uniref:Uncharacterized protein n=1 Tax=Plasmodium falciparum (isolate 7G8) TaxID=57266 RepID=W7FEN6_PLAF8|nr:hypothetical protein PFBG_05348 [Plasmodium falciparum 7G8]